MRSVLHVDMDAFYASVEQAERPELRGLPVVVGGDEEARHGIVLTASYEAKRRGVKTAMTLRETRAVCPDAVVVPPNYPLYRRYSRMARQVCYDYSPLVEPFGLDESWVDVTGSLHMFDGDPVYVAEQISGRFKAELGVTASVGVGFDKVTAKWGSDHDKPDGLTVVTPENLAGTMWRDPVGELLYVGPATERRLRAAGVDTIGDLARAEDWVLSRALGKVGPVLGRFARGEDGSPVRPLSQEAADVERGVKSVGNSFTLPFDADTPELVRQGVWLLGESVCQRLRALGLEAGRVSVSMRDARSMATRSRQRTLARPSDSTGALVPAMAEIAREGWDVEACPVRSIGVRASSLSPAARRVQLDLFGEEEARVRARSLDRAVDECRRRFGNLAVRRGACSLDERLAALDPERDNVVHPVSYFA